MIVNHRASLLDLLSVNFLVVGDPLLVNDTVKLWQGSIHPPVFFISVNLIIFHR